MTTSKIEQSTPIDSSLILRRLNKDDFLYLCVISLSPVRRSRWPYLLILLTLQLKPQTSGSKFRSEELKDPLDLLNEWERHAVRRVHILPPFFYCGKLSILTVHQISIHGHFTKPCQGPFIRNRMLLIIDNDVKIRIQVSNPLGHLFIFVLPYLLWYFFRT